jgi:hypothetical protein
MAFALRYSRLPLIDSIMHLAFDNGVEDGTSIQPSLTCAIEHSALSLPRFTLTQYFESECN